MVFDSKYFTNIGAVSYTQLPSLYPNSKYYLDESMHGLGLVGGWSYMSADQFKTVIKSAYSQICDRDCLEIYIKRNESITWHGASSSIKVNNANGVISVDSNLPEGGLIFCNNYTKVPSQSGTMRDYYYELLCVINL